MKLNQKSIFIHFMSLNNDKIKDLVREDYEI